MWYDNAAGGQLHLLSSDHDIIMITLLLIEISKWYFQNSFQSVAELICCYKSVIVVEANLLLQTWTAGSYPYVES